MTSKTQNWGGKSKNVELQNGVKNLRSYQLKIDCYRCKFLYVRLIVTTKQKPRENIQKIMRKNYKHTIKESHQTSRKRKEKERNRKELQKQPKTINKMVISTYLPIITFNVNGLNSLIKTHTVAKWIKREDPSIYCLQKTHFRCKDTYRIKVK